MYEAGDIVWVTFDPSFGHEQKGRRPALVLSKGDYNAESSLVIVCPISSNLRPWPFKVILEHDLGVAGAILVDQVRAVDRRRLVSLPIARVSELQLQEVLARLEPIVGLQPVPPFPKS